MLEKAKNTKQKALRHVARAIVGFVVLVFCVDVIILQKDSDDQPWEFDALVDKWYWTKETYRDYIDGQLIDEEIIDEHHPDGHYEFFANNRFYFYSEYRGIRAYNGNYILDKQNRTLTIHRDDDMEEHKLVFQIRELTRTNLVLYRVVEGSDRGSKTKYERIFELKRRLTDADIPKIKLTLTVLDASSATRDNPNATKATGAKVDVFLSEADLKTNKPAFSGTTNGQGLVETILPTQNSYLVKASKGIASNTMDGYPIAGLFQSQQQVQDWPYQPFDREIGALKFTDVNGDGVVNIHDRIGYSPVGWHFGSKTVTSTIYISNKVQDNNNTK